MTQIIPPIIVIGYPGGSGGGGSGGGSDSGSGYNTSTTNAPDWGPHVEAKVQGLWDEAIQTYGADGGGKIKALLESLMSSDRSDILYFIANNQIKFELLTDNTDTMQLGHNYWHDDPVTGRTLIIQLNPIDINARIAYEPGRYADQWAISFTHELGHGILGPAGSHATLEGSQNLAAWIKGVGYSAGMIADNFEATAWGAYFW